MEGLGTMKVQNSDSSYLQVMHSYAITHATNSDFQFDKCICGIPWCCRKEGSAKLVDSGVFEGEGNALHQVHCLMQGRT